MRPARSDYGRSRAPALNGPASVAGVEPRRPPGRPNSRIVAVLVLGSLLHACAVPGPPTWPTRREATRVARRQGPSDLELARTLMQQLADGDRQAFLDRLSPGIELAPALLDRAIEQLSARGRSVGVVEERVHREGRLQWYSGLWVVRRGVRRPHQLLLQFGTDAFGRVERFVLREHPFREQVIHPADGYETVNRMRMPADGTWVVLQGGEGPERNNHWRNVEQRHAYDLIVRRGGRARSNRGPDTNNATHYAHGRPVIAPAPGIVVFARDGVPENEPGVRGEKGGNGLVIDHGFGEYTALWHFIPGTLTVQVGDQVEWGQRLGQVGNSGRSTLPHIHVHVVSGPPGGRPTALPLRWVDLEVDGEAHASFAPERGHRIRRLPAAPPNTPESSGDVLLRF